MPAQRRQEPRSKDPLSVTHPQLAAEWHPTRNGNLTPGQVRASSRMKVWWKCSRAPDHEWQASLSSRADRRGMARCPYCLNQKVCSSNCLAATHPELAKEWHPSKNGELTPK